MLVIKICFPYKCFILFKCVSRYPNVACSVVDFNDILVQISKAMHDKFNSHNATYFYESMLYQDQVLD